jgi:hypothetical protein
MSNLLKEILDMVALPFKWIDNERAIFRFNDAKFGIHAEYQTLKLSTRQISIVNISFGKIKSKNFQGADDLDTSLTNFGKPRTFLSTVAEACLANNEILDCDIISLAAADQVKNKRILLYSLAGSEIKNKRPEFRGKDINIKAPNGTIAFLLSKIEFTPEEQELIKQELNFDKV